MQARADQTAPRPLRRCGELHLKLFDCHITVISSIVKCQTLPYVHAQSLGSSEESADKTEHSERK